MGKATKAATAEGLVKMRVLTDCQHGKANDVVEVTQAEADTADKAAVGSTDPAGIAYAETLPQNNQPDEAA